MAAAGVDTAQAAEAHLKKQALYRSREGEILRLLDQPPRPLVEKERKKVAAWTDMGFADEVLRLAYEKDGLQEAEDGLGLHERHSVRLAPEEPAHPGGGGGRRPAAPPGGPSPPCRAAPPPPARPTSGCGRIWSGCGSSCAASRRRRESKPWDTSRRVLRRATARLEAQRKAREEAQERLRSEIYAKLPRVAAIDRELRRTITQIIAASLRDGSDPVPAIGVIRDKKPEPTGGEGGAADRARLSRRRPGRQARLPQVQRHRLGGGQYVRLP